VCRFSDKNVIRTNHGFEYIFEDLPFLLSHPKQAFLLKTAVHWKIMFSLIKRTSEDLIKNHSHATFQALTSNQSGCTKRIFDENSMSR